MAKRRPSSSQVMKFPAGELWKKTVYFSPEEWRAIEDWIAEQKKQGYTRASAVELVRRLVREELGLEED